VYWLSDSIIPEYVLPFLKDFFSDVPSGSLRAICTEVLNFFPVLDQSENYFYPSKSLEACLRDFSISNINWMLFFLHASRELFEKITSLIERSDFKKSLEDLCNENPESRIKNVAEILFFILSKGS
jgi:hypothetical protein